MAKVLKFEKPIKPLIIGYCDKPDCIRCKGRENWTQEDYDSVSDQDKHWMRLKGFKPIELDEYQEKLWVPHNES